jgi:O-antigen/teichoic acid export membrane protein
VQLAVAYVAVAATVAQLGMVNAVFRFAVERRGDERWVVVRSAIAFCAVSGAVVTALSLAATPWGSQWVGSRPLWIVTCAGLWISLLYEPMVGLYRVEQRPQRYVAITVVNVAVTVVASVAAVTVFSFGAAGLLAGSFTGTALALGLVALDRRLEVFGHVDRALLRPMLRFGLPFVPSRLALWGLTWASVVLLAALDSRSAAGVFSVAYRVAQVVALLVTAFQLAWPPFAYSIHDDGEARRVYRAVLTYWLLLSLWAVLGLALLRDPIMRALPGGYEAAAGPMAVYALGLAFYGAYYVVAVAVGRVKKTGFNWVATGTAAAVSVALCVVLIPRYGVMGGAVAPCVARFAR